MKNIQKYSKTIVSIVLVVIGLIAVLLGSNPKVQYGLGLACFSVAVFILAWTGKNKQNELLKQFDNEANDILKDLAEKGDKSEYFNIYNVERLNKLRDKFIKKQRKQMLGIYIIGAILLIIAMINLFK